MIFKAAFSAYFLKWYIPAVVWLSLYFLWFIENNLAFGPGLDMWWMFAWFFNVLVYFITMLCHKGRRKLVYFGAIVFCGVVQFGGCRAYDCFAPPVPESEECHFSEYDRLRLGRYSHCIPVGARNITFSYYDGLFAGYHVTCEVSEKDFLWFCWRNRYKLRKGVLPINERTGDATSTHWFEYDPNRIQDYYSYFDVAKSCAGRRILYDTKTQKLSYYWSTN